MAGVSKAEIAALLQSDDPLTKRLATSLSNLSSNLAKAQAQAATDAVNNGAAPPAAPRPQSPPPRLGRPDPSTPTLDARSCSFLSQTSSINFPPLPKSLSPPRPNLSSLHLLPCNLLQLHA